MRSAPARRVGVHVTALALLLVACAHESVWLGDPLPKVEAPPEPLPLTIGVRLGAFEDARVQGRGVIDRFAERLRGAALFQGVMYPIPPGVEPTWLLRVSGHDSALEPDSNFWKSFFANALPPFALFLMLRNDYTLELEALLIKDRELIATYTASAPIQNRYQVQAPRDRVDAQGLELAVGGATQSILAALSRDLPQLRALNGR